MQFPCTVLDLFKNSWCIGWPEWKKITIHDFYSKLAYSKLIGFSHKFIRKMAFKRNANSRSSEFSLFSGCNFMQRMLLRSRPLYNSVSTKGAKYSDTATRFLDLSNTCRRSWYQRKILWVTRKYKRISKVHQYSRICILVPAFYLISMTTFLYKEKFIISMPFLLHSLFNRYVYIILMIYIFLSNYTFCLKYARFSNYKHQSHYHMFAFRNRCNCIIIFCYIGTMMIITTEILVIRFIRKKISKCPHTFEK